MGWTDAGSSGAEIATKAVGEGVGYDAGAAEAGA